MTKNRLLKFVLFCFGLDILLNPFEISCAELNIPAYTWKPFGMIPVQGANEEYYFRTKEPYASLEISLHTPVLSSIDSLAMTLETSSSGSVYGWIELDGQDSESRLYFRKDFEKNSPGHVVLKFNENPIRKLNETSFPKLVVHFAALKNTEVTILKVAVNSEIMAHETHQYYEKHLLKQEDGLDILPKGGALAGLQVAEIRNIDHLRKLQKYLDHTFNLLLRKRDFVTAKKEVIEIQNSKKEEFLSRLSTQKAVSMNIDNPNSIIRQAVDRAKEQLKETEVKRNSLNERLKQGLQSASELNLLVSNAKLKLESIFRERMRKIEAALRYENAYPPAQKGLKGEAKHGTAVPDNTFPASESLGDMIDQFLDMLKNERTRLLQEEVRLRDNLTQHVRSNRN